MNSKELKVYSSSIDYILEVQNQDGSIPWEKGKKLDPWDHIEAAMGLSIAGNKVEAEKAFNWLSDNQLDDALGTRSILNQFRKPKDEKQISQHT